MMKSKKPILAALTAAIVLSAGSMTAFAAENTTAAGVCPYVCAGEEGCYNGYHDEDCPVYGCENHREHCAYNTSGCRNNSTSYRSGHHGGGHHGRRHH